MHTKLKELLKLSSSIVPYKKSLKEKKNLQSSQKICTPSKVLTKFVHYLPI